MRAESPLTSLIFWRLGAGNRAPNPPKGCSEHLWDLTVLQTAPQGAQSDPQGAKIDSGTQCAPEPVFFSPWSLLWVPKWDLRVPKGTPKEPKGVPKPRLKTIKNGGLESHLVAQGAPGGSRGTPQDGK